MNSTFDQEEDEFDEAIGLLQLSNDDGGGGRAALHSDHPHNGLCCDEDYDDDEIEAMMEMNQSSKSSHRKFHRRHGLCSMSQPNFWWFVTIGTVFTLTNLLLYTETKKAEHADQAMLGAWIASNSNTTETPGTVAESGILRYDCPASHRPENYDASFEEDYINITRAADIYEFHDTFRDKKYDAWGRSYTKFKAQLRDWKVRYFVPYLTTAATDEDRPSTNQPITIFESACGLGLNLYMTLEILKEELLQLEANATDQNQKNNSSGDILRSNPIVVYGNEYVPESTQTANDMFDLFPPYEGVQKGTICSADSMDLSFVPSNSFDLVYTGYLR